MNPEADIAPIKLKEPEFVVFVVRISWMEGLPSSFSKNSLPS